MRSEDPTPWAKPLILGVSVLGVLAAVVLAVIAPPGWSKRIVYIPVLMLTGLLVFVIAAVAAHIDQRSGGSSPPVGRTRRPADVGEGAHGRSPVPPGKGAQRARAARAADSVWEHGGPGGSAGEMDADRSRRTEGGRRLPPATGTGIHRGGWSGRAEQAGRGGLPLVPPRWLQVVTPRTAELYRTNHVVAGFSPLFVSGFMVPLTQVGPAPTADHLVSALRPDHPGAGGDTGGFLPPDAMPGTTTPSGTAGTDATGQDPRLPDGGVLVLTFDLDSDDSRAPVISRTSGRIGDGHFAAPWTGSGHPASATPSFIDEYVALEPLHLLPGALLEHIGQDGTRSPVCRLEIDPDGRWTWRDPTGAAQVEDSRTTDLHELFIDRSGLWPVDPLDARHGLVLAPDRRVLRLGLAGVLEATDVAGTTARGLVDRLSTSEVAVRTTVDIAGLTCTVRTMRLGPKGQWLLGVTHVGRCDGEARRLGFWGDQYTGLHAEFPEDAFDHSTTERIVVRRTHVPHGSLPAAPPFPGTSVPETPEWHREFLQLGSGAVVAVEGGSARPLARVPDPRAAELMFPGCAGTAVDDSGDTWADLTGVSGVLVDAVTRAALADDFEVLVVGEEGHSIRYVNIPRNGTDPYRNMVRSIDVRRVGPQRDLLVEPGTWGAGE